MGKGVPPMREMVKQALSLAALVLVLALPGCAGSALLTAQGPTVDAAALHDLAGAVPATEEADAAPTPAPQDVAVPEAAMPEETDAAPAEEDAALTVDPGLFGQQNSALSALAAWSGLARLRDTVTEHPIELEVPNILQNPELPNGCEITSAAVALNYLGIPADKVVLAERYLPCGEDHLTADPEQEYMGSPFAGQVGYYCMPAPIETAVNAYLGDIGNTDRRARDVSGADIEELKAYLHDGAPVLVWVTQYFEEPRYADHFTLPDGSQPYVNLHCVVLTGYDDDTFYLTDPLEEKDRIDAATFAHIYGTMGCHALVIEKQ